MANLSRQTIERAIEQASGNLTRAADILGIARRTLYNYLDKYPELKEVVEQHREILVDEAESALLNLVREGNVAGVIFALKTQGWKRGYIERQRNDVTLQIDGLPDLLKAIEQAGLSPRDVIRALTDEIQSTLPKPD